MDSIKDEYLLDEIMVVHLKSDLNKLLLPDFSLPYAVLAPDVAIIRVPPGETGKFKSFIFDDEDKFVQGLNSESMQSAKNWVVANSEGQLEMLGATKFR